MQFERNNKLITSKFWQFFIPTVLSVFAANMAIFVDAVIVSSLVGVEALSGLQIIFPFISFVDLLCWMIGLGGGILCASAKANFDEKQANTIYSAAIISIVFICIIIAVIGLLFPEIVIGGLSGSVHLNTYALEYFKMYIGGLPFAGLMFVLFYFVEMDGMPKFASIALVVASILDPLFDVILIQVFHMGMAGSGLATAISYVGGAIIMALYFFKPNKTLHLVKINLITLIKDFINICKSGFGGASTQLYITIATIFYNAVIISFLGDGGLVAQEICTNMLLIISIFFIGLVEAISPIIAVYYNDNDYNAIDNLKNISFKFITIVSVIFTGAMIFCPDLILTIFSVKAQYSAIVANAVRLYGLYFLPLGFVFFYIFYTQSIQKNKVSNIVALFFNLVLVLAMLMVLPKLFGSNSIWITPFCVGAIMLLGIVIYSRYLHKKTDGEYHGIFINKSHDGNFLEFTINANVNDVNGLVDVIRDELKGNELSECVCSSIEEFLIDVIETNDKLDTIDVLLDVGKESIKIYIKDLGSEKGDKFTFKNNNCDFEVTFDHAWVLGLNSTVITIKN